MPLLRSTKKRESAADIAVAVGISAELGWRERARGRKKRHRAGGALVVVDDGVSTARVYYEVLKCVLEG